MSSKRSAVFLDRDGTVIEEVDFLSRVDDMRIFPFTREALALLKENGYLVFILTNQSGIGRGLFTEADMHGIHEALQSEVGGLIDGFFYCPHRPEFGCECRKPGIGMIEAACDTTEIDLKSSWMVGDKSLDVMTGHNAGIRSVLVRTGYGQTQDPPQSPTLIADNLFEAVKQILAS
jgi:D-glycero-D-manno-heptose 1,7-bisphosphate phosphatase